MNTNNSGANNGSSPFEAEDRANNGNLTTGSFPPLMERSSFDGRPVVHHHFFSSHREAYEDDHAFAFNQHRNGFKRDRSFSSDVEDMEDVASDRSFDGAFYPDQLRED